MQVLCLNAGSSTLKAVGFADTRRVVSELVDHLDDRVDATPDAYIDALGTVADACARADFTPDAVAHRFVHGGRDVLEHVVVDDAVRTELAEAVPFAPLHMPVALAVLDAARARYDAVAQVACLDTAFHRHLVPASRRLPIPEELHAAGVRRYGFHGLSYEYLVHRLGATLGRRAVLAHLGNGASLAAVLDGIGVDTTMGFTPAGGLVMGTRPGDLDPGVLLYVLRERGLDVDALDHLVNHQSGLAGLAGASDVRNVLEARDRGDARAALALDVYETAAAKHVAALTTVLGGLDTLVFTGGVGEHAATIRAGIAARLFHLGVALDGPANDAGAPVVSEAGAPVTVRVEPTDEELMMALHTARLVGDG